MYVCLRGRMDVNPASIQHLSIRNVYPYEKISYPTLDMFSMTNTNFMSKLSSFLCFRFVGVREKYYTFWMLPTLDTPTGFALFMRHHLRSRKTWLPFKEAYLLLICTMYCERNEPIYNCTPCFKFIPNDLLQITVTNS